MAQLNEASVTRKAVRAPMSFCEAREESI